MQGEGRGKCKGKEKGERGRKCIGKGKKRRECKGKGMRGERRGICKG